MKNLKITKITEEYLEFNNGTKLLSEHQQDCCEYHYLSFKDLEINDFNGLEFDLSKDGFFKRIPDYGIELIPIKGHSIKIPGYGYNNGYYNSNLDLCILYPNGNMKKFEIDDCQIIEG